MTMTFSQPPRPFRGGAKRTNRVRYVVECLEERTVLSHVAQAPAINEGIADVAKAAKQSVMTVTSVVVNDIGLSNEQLIANATLNGTIKGQSVSLPLVIPITLTPASSSTSTSSSVTSAAAAPTQVLNLSLGAVNLSLLGLNVHLGGSNNFGDTTPITAQVVAIPTGSTYTANGTTYAGGLLGSVLSDVANLLNSGGALSGLGGELDSLETNLTTLVNQILGGLNSSNSAASMTSTATTKAHAAKAVSHSVAKVHRAAMPMATTGGQEVLDLHLAPITLDVLGAYVHTSDIYLNITASKGPGNLLGNLL